MELIINLTQHKATPEQLKEGVIDLPDHLRTALIEALTFEELPTVDEINGRAKFIAHLAFSNDLGKDCVDDPIPKKALIGGALFLMKPLEEVLTELYVQPLYAFTQRNVVEKDGVKTSQFRHEGFITSVTWAHRVAS